MHIEAYTRCFIKLRLKRGPISGSSSQDCSSLLLIFYEYVYALCLGSSTRGVFFWPYFHGPDCPYDPKIKHPVFDHKVPKDSQQKFFKTHQQASKFWFGFMFVRDPFERAVSAYYNKVKGKNLLKGKNWTISEYFDHLVKHNVQDEHFKLQQRVCDPCYLNVDYLGRTETMISDIDAIINHKTKLHLNIPFDPREDHSKVSLNNTTNKSMQDIYRELDPKLMKKFIWKYRLDYLAFGYNPYKVLSKLSPK